MHDEESSHQGRLEDYSISRATERPTPPLGVRVTPSYRGSLSTFSLGISLCQAPMCTREHLPKTMWSAFERWRTSVHSVSFVCRTTKIGGDAPNDSERSDIERSRVNNGGLSISSNFERMSESLDIAGKIRRCTDGLAVGSAIIYDLSFWVCCQS